MRTNDSRQTSDPVRYLKSFFRILPYWIVQLGLFVIWWKTGSIIELIIVSVISELLAWGQTPEDNNNNKTSTRE